jgi:hypothetical protein
MKMAHLKNLQMHQASETGIILMRENILLPPNLSLDCEPFTSGWKVVKNLDSYAFSRRIKEKHWSFVRLDVQRRVRILGLATQGTLRRGVDRILQQLRGRRFNSLEVTVIVFKRFLGLTYLGISARLRHVQEDGGSSA